MKNSEYMERAKKRNGLKPGPKKVFTKSFLRQVELLAKLGATQKQIAEFFEKDVTTIEKWIQNDPIFKRALKKGGMLADLDVVQALFRRATGYTFEEQQLVMTRDGPQTFKVKKHVIPSERSIQLWLTNRQRELWTNTNQLNVTGTVNHNHREAQDIPVEDLSSKAQEFLFEIGKKQLTDGSRNN